MTLPKPRWQGAATRTMHINQQMVCVRVVPSIILAKFLLLSRVAQWLCPRETYPRETRGPILPGKSGLTERAARHLTSFVAQSQLHMHRW